MRKWCCCRAVQISKKFEVKFYGVITAGLEDVNNRLSYIIVDACEFVHWQVSRPASRHLIVIVTHMIIKNTLSVQQ